MHTLSHPALDQLQSIFDHHVAHLLQHGYVAAAGLDQATFMDHIRSLKTRLTDIDPPPNTAGHMPLVVVLNPLVLPAARHLPSTIIQAVQGHWSLMADDLERFVPLPNLDLPTTPVYVLIDVDTDQATRNLTPDAALPLIQAAHRSPLTLHEGVAVLAHYPKCISKNNGFSLLGSRCGDRRVTALWISQGKPKLGWCWAGNPHTWLGSASCAMRLS